jgi:tetratricopeptide (TPR) repeat protein
MAQGSSARCLLLFCFAFAARAIYLLELSDTILLEVLIGDGEGYDRWARGLLADGGRTPDVFYQAPLYPYLLAGVYGLTGPSPVLVLWLQAALGAASCVLLALAGRRFFGERAGWIAGALLAIYPFALFYTGLIQKTALALFFLCLLLWLLAKTRDAPGWRLPLAAGLALGALSLLRENALALLPLVALWLLFEPREASGRQRVLRAATLCAGMLLMLGPVAWRNAAHGGGGLIPTSFQLGTNLYAGNHHGSSGRYVPPREGGGFPGREESDATQLAEAATGEALTPAGVSRYFVAKTFEEIRAEPLSWLALMLRKSVLLWNAEEVLDTEAPEVYADESILLRGLAAGFHFGVLFPIALWGVVATLPDRRRLSILYVLLLGMAASVVLFFVLGRLRFPLVPILILFAAAGIAALPRLRGAGPVQLALCVGCLFFGGLLANWPLGGGVREPRALTYNDLGVALRLAGRPDEALGWFDRAIARDADYYRAYLNKGETLRARGQTEAAIRLAREAVALQPASAVSRQYLAIALMDAGRRREALMEIRHALELDPGNVAFESLLGLLLLQQGRPGEAIPHLESYVKRRPDDPRGHNNLGAALHRSGRVEEARGAFRAALRLDPGHEDARRNLDSLDR